MTTFKITCISDTHEKHRVLSIPECDFLLCAGDISFTGALEKVSDFCQWMKDQPAKHKLLTFGNHELSADPSSPVRPLILNLVRENGIHLLEDTGIEIEGVKFFGSAYSIRFFDWAFQLDPWNAKDHWSKISDDTNILLTHQPPLGIGDKTERGDQIGCPELLERIKHLPDLKLHLFGHNHAGYGRFVRYFDGRRVELVNGSINTEGYLPINKPIFLEVEI